MSKSLMAALISVSLVLSPTAQAGFLTKALVVGGAVVVGKAVARKHSEQVQRMQNLQTTQNQQSQAMQPGKQNKTSHQVAPENNEQVQQFLDAYR